MGCITPATQMSLPMIMNHSALHAIVHKPQSPNLNNWSLSYGSSVLVCWANTNWTTYPLALPASLTNLHVTCSDQLTSKSRHISGNKPQLNILTASHHAAMSFIWTSGSSEHRQAITPGQIKLPTTLFFLLMGLAHTSSLLMGLPNAFGLSSPSPRNPPSILSRRL